MIYLCPWCEHYEQMKADHKARCPYRDDGCSMNEGFLSRLLYNSAAKQEELCDAK